MKFQALVLCAIAAMVPWSASAASLYITPQSATKGLTDTFIAEIRLDNANECINAAHVEVRYPTDVLRAVDFSKGGSILSLWIEEPKIDVETGVVTFSGGIPGGYCGRIQGDPVLSNVVGKIVFTVVGTGANTADLALADTSVVYLNDGAATKAPLTLAGATYAIVDTPQQAENPWLAEVGEDTIQPDPFVITVESTRGVFRGNYYAVFSTVDKQSGIDHYEILEQGVWQRVTSPHELRDQYLREGVQIKAIDKAGNERIGEFVEGSQAPRVPRELDYSLLALALFALLLGGGYAWFRYRRNQPVTPDA